MALRQNQKGNGYEAIVAKELTKWYGPEFHRIPNSGSLRWNGYLFAYGDILCPESFPCIIECKHYKKISFEDLLSKIPKKTKKGRAEPNILSWWKHQLLEDVKRCENETGMHLIPLLIFRRNYQSDKLCLETSIFNQFSFASDITSLTVTSINIKEQITIIEFDKFLQYMKVQEFSDICSKELSSNGRARKKTRKAIG